MRISDWSSDVCSSDLVEADMMGAAINAVDDREGAAGELVVEAARDEATDDRIAGRLEVQSKRRRVESHSAPLHFAVHRLDDVAAIGEYAPRALGARVRHSLQMRSSTWRGRNGKAV